MTITRRHFATTAAAVGAAVGLGGADQAIAAAPAGPLDEGLFVPINGLEQWITIRGRDARNPVILFLHGGPGLASSNAAPMFGSWEAGFTVVHWDQPGSGATHAKNLGRDQGAFTKERFLADAIAVAEWTRRRLKVHRLIVMGASWGTILGVMLVQARPDLALAYVGAGQVVSRERGDLMGYELALAKARARGATGVVAGLEKVGPPPYPTADQWFVRQQYTNPPGQPPSAAEVAYSAELGQSLRAVDKAKAAWIAKDVPGYDVIANFMAVQRTVYARQGRRYEASDYGLTFKVPVFVIQGELDLNTPTPLAHEWFGQVKAPAKAYLEVAGAGHGVLLFQREVAAFLTREVRPAILKRRA